MKELDNIPKSKFTIVKTEEKILDVAFDSQPIGFYKDAWNRFKKNKASLISLILLGFMLLMVLFAPLMKNYDLFERDAKVANRLKELPPRVRGLEKIGIFDGSKKLDGRLQTFVDMLPEGIVIKQSNKRTINGVDLVDIKVNYYMYLDYTNSYLNEDMDIPTINLTKEEYEDALERGVVISLVSETNGVYKTQIKLFEYAINKTGADTYFWFGTDSQGKDFFTVLWKAGRISLLMATVVTLINVSIGVVLGSIAGYYGGKIDLYFERFIDILGNIPFMAVLTLLLLRFGTSTWIVIVAFISTGWIGAYGATRSQFYRYKNREYVLAARTMGASDRRIMSKYIFPNAIGTLITSFALMIPSFIFTESTYSFLGIINYSNTTSIGRLLSTGQAAMQQHAHLLLFPAVFISILMLSFNLMSNGLRDAFNPSLRGVE